MTRVKRLRFASLLSGLLFLPSCQASSLVDAPGQPPTEIFNGNLTPAAPFFTTTLGPAPAGPWRADLAYADPRQPASHSISMIVRDEAGKVVATGSAVTPFFRTGQWAGGEGARYRIDLLLEDTTGLGDELGEIFTLEVTHPTP